MVLAIASRIPLVSIIILNYNGIQYLERCIQTVLKTEYPDFEVIFVDNGSTDNSVELVEEKFGGESRLVVVRNMRNLGFAEGNNIGIKYAKGDYIVFLNNDTEVDSNWLKELIEVMESDLTIGAAQSKLSLLSDRKRFDSAGHYLTAYGYLIDRGRFEEDKGQYDRVKEVFGAKGAAMIVRRRTLEEVGSFDPVFFLMFEESDLCWRIWLRGYKVVFVPGSIVFHARGATSRKHRHIETISHFYFLRNQMLSMIKNYEMRNLIRYLPLRVALELRRLGTSLLKGKRRQAVEVIKAILWNLVNFEYSWKERLKIQYSIRRVPDSYIMTRVFKG